MRNLAIGVDVGGSHVCSAVIDLAAGQIIGQRIQTDIPHTSPADELFAAWADNIAQCLRQAPEPVTRIGMDFPGPFDYVHGISQMDHKLPHIKGLNVADELRSRIAGGENLKFRFVNDASAFALGECHFGAARGVEKVVVLAIGTGFGSGFVSGGKIVEDGETVPPGGEVWNLPWAGSIADDWFSTRGILARYQTLTGELLEGAKDVADRYATDPAAQDTWHAFGRELAQFTARLIQNFGATTVLLGGNIARSLHLFQPEMDKTYASVGLKADIKPCALLSDAAMMGAATLFV